MCFVALLPPMREALGLPAIESVIPTCRVSIPRGLEIKGQTSGSPPRHHHQSDPRKKMLELVVVCRRPVLSLLSSTSLGELWPQARTWPLQQSCRPTCKAIEGRAHTLGMATLQFLAGARGREAHKQAEKGKMCFCAGHCYNPWRAGAHRKTSPMEAGAAPIARASSA